MTNNENEARLEWYRYQIKNYYKFRHPDLLEVIDQLSPEELRETYEIIKEELDE